MHGPIVTRPAAGAVVHHLDSRGRALIYVGQVIVRGGRIEVIPCRGLTNAQAVKLLTAYQKLRDQDVWATYYDGMITHVSVLAECVLTAWLPPRLLRQIRRGTWAGKSKKAGREFYRKPGPPRAPLCLGLGRVESSDEQQVAE